jgi:phosphohistidine phosphatase SixA
MTLTIDLLRHGEALPAHDAVDDSERLLSDGGRRQLERLATRLSTEGWRPTRVFSSPYRRARDTARIVMGPSTSLHLAAIPELSPEHEPEDALRALAAEGVGVGDHILVVAHQPLLGRIAGLLTGVARGFPPGGLARIVSSRGLSDRSAQLVLEIEPAQED